MDGHFHWVAWEVGMALGVLDGLLDGLFGSVGWDLGTALDIME